jgi:hypothetical protein
MVIQRPLEVQESNLAGNSALVPAAAQQQPLPKPTLHQHILCPNGSLGCN